MSERETNRTLHEYEQRIKELKAALKWVIDYAGETIPVPDEIHISEDGRRWCKQCGEPMDDESPAHLTRIREHAQAALQHDHVEHGKGWV